MRTRALQVDIWLKALCAVGGLATALGACGAPTDESPGSPGAAGVAGAAIEGELRAAPGDGLAIPDLDGELHVVKSTGLVVQGNRVVWNATVEKVPYEVVAEAGGGATRIVVSRAAIGTIEELMEFFVDAGGVDVQATVASGTLGVSYGAGVLAHIAGRALTLADVPALAGYFDSAIPEVNGIAVGLALYGLPGVIDQMGQGDPPEGDASFLGGILKVLKKIGELLAGGGGGGSGGDPGCQGGSSASCSTPDGGHTEVHCASCGAHCDIIQGVAGETCSCSCF